MNPVDTVSIDPGAYPFDVISEGDKMTTYVCPICQLQDSTRYCPVCGYEPKPYAPSPDTDEPTIAELEGYAFDDDHWWDDDTDQGF